MDNRLGFCTKSRFKTDVFLAPLLEKFIEYTRRNFMGGVLNEDYLNLQKMQRHRQHNSM